MRPLRHGPTSIQDSLHRPSRPRGGSREQKRRRSSASRTEASATSCDVATFIPDPTAGTAPVWIARRSSASRMRGVSSWLAGSPGSRACPDIRRTGTNGSRHCRSHNAWGCVECGSTCAPYGASCPTVWDPRGAGRIGLTTWSSLPVVAASRQPGSPRVKNGLATQASPVCGSKGISALATPHGYGPPHRPHWPRRGRTQDWGKWPGEADSRSWARGDLPFPRHHPVSTTRQLAPRGLRLQVAATFMVRVASGQPLEYWRVVNA